MNLILSLQWQFEVQHPAQVVFHCNRGTFQCGWGCYSNTANKSSDVICMQRKGNSGGYQVDGTPAAKPL